LVQHTDLCVQGDSTQRRFRFDETDGEVMGFMEEGAGKLTGIHVFATSKNPCCPRFIARWFIAVG
jgi:hypothetical protein